MTNWLFDLAHFFGGAFLANAVPHFVSGIMGRPFQTPFARPRGVGLSSSTVNIAWSFANLAAAYALILHVGRFDVRDVPSMATLGLGMLVISLFLARHFGRFHGGNLGE